MKNLAMTAAALVVAGPAFAHGGAHLHPHGFELAVGFGAACAVVGLWLVSRGK